jgi:hypothetical protein
MAVSAVVICGTSGTSSNARTLACVHSLSQVQRLGRSRVPADAFFLLEILHMVPMLVSDPADNAADSMPALGLFPLLPGFVARLTPTKAGDFR